MPKTFQFYSGIVTQYSTS